jgi:hypothetical protein
VTDHSNQRITSTSPDAVAILARAREVMGVDRANGRIVHYRAATADEQNYQSDRPYPPFFLAVRQQEIWFDPGNRVLRIQSETMYPGSTQPASTMLDDGTNAAIVRGNAPVAVSRQQATARPLNVWATVADWSAATGVRVVGTEMYRDYERVVLTRTGPGGDQRLYIDAKSGFPVKLDLIERHYLWGQRRVEYLWSTWTMTDGIVVPGAAFRQTDGAIELSQTVGGVELIAPGAAPAMTAPAAPTEAPPELPLFLQPIAPRTTRVSSNICLLTNPGYTEAVAVAGDEVFVLDATQGEERARQDADAIANLFPGRHKITVVVTDLAWPHIAGVRYWVSQGATIMAHSAARAFLQQVVDRRWTIAPDSLEMQRTRDSKSGRMHFIGIDRPFSAAGGAIQLMPIDGIGSEVALMAHFPHDRFLWASDYIQTLDKPTLYATEVIRAVERAGIVPEQAAAEHLPLSDWKTIVSAQTKDGR